MSSPSSLARVLVAELASDADALEELRGLLDVQPKRARLLTSEEAGERLHLHPRTVARMARDGRLAAEKPGGGRGWRFREDALHVLPVFTSAPGAQVRRPRRQTSGHADAIAAVLGESLTPASGERTVVRTRKRPSVAR